ncbi:MAG TPA: hypothetical protein VM368_00585, partial [Flavisolibacter sp.]|nr:hypothetical protein [Flavisolibacter sp.]
MVIAINARFLIKDKLEGYGYFINQVIRIWTNQHPQHQFHIILDREFGAPVNYSENVHIHVVGPQARHPILWKVWFDVRVPILLKKIKADIFLSPDGFCSLTTKVPQCLIIHDLGFLHYPDTYLRN